jgi:hypothetical protein
MKYSTTMVRGQDGSSILQSSIHVIGRSLVPFVATLLVASTVSYGVFATGASASVATVIRGATVHESPRTTSQIYTAGELYGGSNPTAFCFTCAASNVAGTAPPSESLNAGSGVSSLTGDYTTSQTLFDAPNFGGDLSFTMSYDAQLAQSEHTAGTGAGQLGWGWTDNLQTSLTNSGSQLTVNQGNDSQDVFTQNPVGNACPTGDQTSENSYTIANSG